MRRKTFKVVTALSAEQAMGRLLTLLDTEGVAHNPGTKSVRSLRTPIPLLSADPRMYSRRNWVGVNPFALVTAIEVNAVTTHDGTVMDVTVDRRRLLVLLAIEIWLVCLIALRAPLAVTIASAVFMLGACLVLLRWSHTLVKYEIEQQLQGEPA